MTAFFCSYKGLKIFKMSLSIIISISNESPKPAIKGILNNLKLIKSIHFIYPNYQNDAESMYPGWSADFKVLTEAGISVHYEPFLNASNFDASFPVVEIHPYCLLKMGAFETIVDTMKHSRRHEMHFSMQPVATLTGVSGWYGFFIILYMLDWICRRTMVYATRIHSMFVLKKGDVQYFPPETSSWWQICREKSTIRGQFTEFADLQMSSNYLIPLLKGVRFFGFWLFLYVPIYLSIFFPFLFFVNLATYAATCYALLCGIAHLTTQKTVRMKHQVFITLISPIYFILFPFLLIHAKVSK